jgi:hypothetical protein
MDALTLARDIATRAEAQGRGRPSPSGAHRITWLTAAQARYLAGLLEREGVQVRSSGSPWASDGAGFGFSLGRLARSGARQLSYSMAPAAVAGA